MDMDERDDLPKRVNISTDAVRALLAEMELRLRIYFDEQLKSKADSASHNEVLFKISKMEQGDFPRAMGLALEQKIDEILEQREGATWTGRERIFASVSAVTATMMVIITIFLAVHGGQTP